MILKEVVGGATGDMRFSSPRGRVELKAVFGCGVKRQRRTGTGTEENRRQVNTGQNGNREAALSGIDRQMRCNETQPSRSDTRPIPKPFHGLMV